MSAKLKIGGLFLFGWAFASLPWQAGASSPIKSPSCSPVSSDQSQVPDDIRASASKLKGLLIEICSDSTNQQPNSFRIQMPYEYDSIGVCAYQVERLFKLDLGGITAWSANDNYGRKDVATYMRLSDNCDDNAKFVLVSSITTGSFVRLSTLWNGLFEPEKMERFISQLSFDNDDKVVDLLKATLRAHAASGKPLALTAMEFGTPHFRAFPHFILRFHDNGREWLVLVDFDNEGLIVRGWGG